MRPFRAVLRRRSAVADYCGMERWWRRFLYRGDLYGPLRNVIVKARTLIVRRVRVLNVTY